MIQNADIVSPNSTISDEKTCTPVDTFFSPKIYKPKNVDSRKNANNPSAARGAPNMSPTNLEYSDLMKKHVLPLIPFFVRRYTSLRMLIQGKMRITPLQPEELRICPLQTWNILTSLCQTGIPLLFLWLLRLRK